MEDYLIQLGYTRITLQAGTCFTPPLLAIPSGTFAMGSDPTIDTLARKGETPQTNATIENAFLMSTFPVTVAEFACMLQENDCSLSERERHYWPLQSHRPCHPVVHISWFSACRYAQWLSHKTNKMWRLPTEAQWEKSARHDDKRIYPWGNDWESNKANTYEARRFTTLPIGSIPTNISPFGVMDMAGNIQEWCSTQYAAYPYGGNDGRENLEDRHQDTYRVLRGGSWKMGRGAARVSSRAALTARLISDDIGLRLICEVSSSSS